MMRLLFIIVKNNTLFQLMYNDVRSRLFFLVIKKINDAFCYMNNVFFFYFRTYV